MLAVVDEEWISPSPPRASWFDIREGREGGMEGRRANKVLAQSRLLCLHGTFC